MKSALTGLVLGLACTTGPAAFAAQRVSLINVDGAIGPATASYISRSIEEARAQNAQCLVIQLNTPGGLLDSTQKIVQSFLGSPVPVVVCNRCRNGASYHHRRRAPRFNRRLPQWRRRKN